MPDARQLEAAKKRIHQRGELRRKRLPFPTGRSTMPLKLTRCTGIAVSSLIVFIAVQVPARIQERARIQSLPAAHRAQQFGRIEHVVAEGVSAHAERARVDVEDLVGDTLLERPLIVQLERLSFDHPYFVDITLPPQESLVIGAGGRRGERSGRRQWSIGRLPDVSGRSGIVLIVLVEIPCL